MDKEGALPESRLTQLRKHAADLATTPVDPFPNWPTPTALTPRLRPVPTFKEDLFPPILLPLLRDVSNRMQCPPDWIAVAWIVILGSVVGTRCGIRPKQLDTAWLEVPNFWAAIVADPSKLKTPTLNAALAPLNSLERAARTEHEQNTRLFEAEADVQKARRESLKKRLTKAADKGNELDIKTIQNELANLDGGAAPVARRYIVKDSTVEKLAELLRDNPRGLLLTRDELMALLTSWEKQGREADRGFFLEAWNGTGDYGSDRIGRGSLYVPNCCLSLLGGIQPDKLDHYIGQTLNGENDGMLQRFSLLTWPDPRPFAYVDATPDAAAQHDATELLRRLDEFDPVQAGATLRAGDTIPAFHFDEEAQACFVTWLTTWQLGLESGDETPALVQHLAKYRKLYPTLALLFHLLDVVSGSVVPGPVGQNATLLAAKWCAYFAEHARRLYAYGASRERHAAALAEHLRARHLESPFTMRDVQRKGWQGLGDGSAIQKALEELLEANWIREAEALPRPATGRPPATAYLVNPRIFS